MPSPNIGTRVVGVRQKCAGVFAEHLPAKRIGTPASVAITRAAAVATVTQVGHTFEDGDYVSILGANEVEYNGIFVITNVTSTTYDYTVTGAPATPATGAITSAGVAFFDASKFSEGLFIYADPDVPADETADAGEAGIFYFGKLPILIYEIRASLGVAKTYTARVADEDGAPSSTILSGVGGDDTREYFHPPVTVLPGERLFVTSSAGSSGEVTVYCVKADIGG